MLLLDDDDELPDLPSEGELLLTAKLSASAVERIDLVLTRGARSSWLKVARVVHEAVVAGGFDPWDDPAVHLHTRRLMRLVEAGILEAQGNLRRPRWSEVRLHAATAL